MRPGTQDAHHDRGDRTDIVTGEIVSPNYFDVLGVPLAAGRTFAPGAERADTPPTAVISHRLWQRDFGGQYSAIGHSITILGRPYTVIGVITPQGSVFGFSLDRLAIAPYTTPLSRVIRPRGQALADGVDTVDVWRAVHQALGLHPKFR